MEPSMMKLQQNEREIHARVFALERARQVRGVIVEAVLSHLPSDAIPVPIPSPAIEAMEEHVQRFVAALLRISIQEFCETWTKELERRLTAVQELHSGAMQAAKEGLV